MEKEEKQQEEDGVVKITEITKSKLQKNKTKEIRIK